MKKLRWNLAVLLLVVALALSLSACKKKGAEEHAHDYGDWAVTVGASCLAEGAEMRVCKTDTTHTETRTVATLGHSYGEWSAPTDNTETEDGTATKSCVRCSKTSVKIVATAGLTYVGVGESEYLVRSYVGSSKEVVIPSHHKGAPITGVHYDAFSNNTDMESVVFDAESVLSDMGSFVGCTNLKSVTVPPSVKTIVPSAFQDCVNLERIKLRDNNLHLSLQDGVVYNKDKTTIIFVPLGITGAITIPASVTTWGEGADVTTGNAMFIGLEKLEKVTILAPITATLMQMFGGCTNLKTVVLPSSVEKISFGAFGRCGSLEEINLSKTLKVIDVWAFLGCASINSLTIPKTVTSIGQMAFIGFTSEQTIYVEGFASEAAADAAWGEKWRLGCEANIEYLG